MYWSNHNTCRAIKKDGNRCKYMCKDNFMCGIHAHKAESLQCSICHEDMTCSNSKTTKCNHTFHIECYEEWRNQSNGNSCPMCRGKIPKMDTQEIIPLVNVFNEHVVKFNEDIVNFIEIQNKVVNMRNSLIMSNVDMLRLINGKLEKNPCRNDRTFLNSMIDYLYKMNRLIKTNADLF